MKKLLITTMAVVSIGLCAKAEDTGVISETSFEGLTTGDDFEIDNDYWQTQGDTEDQFKIIDVEYSETATQQHWDLVTEEKALSIDTANPILRNVNPEDGETGENTAQDVSPTPVFFDSVVQFTATDVAPSMENNTTDKLAVWLYSTPEDTEGRLFGEDDAVTNLVITAGYYDGNTLKTTNYFTNVAIEPDTWHRLTIKSFKNNNSDLVFNIWVDKTQVAVDGATDFLSRISDKVSTNIPYDQLQGVAFDGKGAVDDIVFTTTAPEFAKEDEPEAPKVFNVAITTPDGVGIVGVLDAEGNAIDTVDAEGKYVVGVDTETITVVVEYAGTVTNEGAELIETGTWGIPVDVSSAKEGDLIQVEITVASGEEPEDPAKPTIGGAPVETAEAFIAAANSGVAIKVPTGWTLDGNTLKDADDNVYATFANYYTVTLETDGTVTLKLNDNAKPTINETATDADDAIVLTDTTVSLGVTNAKASLWYGVQAYSDAACTTKIGDEPTGWKKATGETVTVIATKPGADKAFFKVVVDDQDHSSATPPEEQN